MLSSGLKSCCKKGEGDLDHRIVLERSSASGSCSGTSGGWLGQLVRVNDGHKETEELSQAR